MRGKDINFFVPVGTFGIIPAHAGKRRKGHEPIYAGWDHPRSCGEKLRAAKWQPPYRGSSPLMRGKEAAMQHCGDYLGIIPAHAGKSVHIDYAQGIFRDHPRSCGEKACRSCAARCTLGSSPLMRGKAAVLHQMRHRIRIIPAHAGKSLSFSVARMNSRDHPRSCGEKSLLLLNPL